MIQIIENNLGNNVDFITTFVMPMLAIAGDTVLRLGFGLDNTDAGADIALAVAVTFLTVFATKLNTQSLSRGELALYELAIMVSGTIWLATLLFLSDVNPLYHLFPPIFSVRGYIVAGVAAVTLIFSSRLLYNLLR